MMPPMGKLLISLGLILLIAGIILLSVDRIPFLGKLPGDVKIKREKFTLYVPVVTMLVISVLLTLVLNLISRGK